MNAASDEHIICLSVEIFNVWERERYEVTCKTSVIAVPFFRKLQNEIQCILCSSFYQILNYTFNIW